MAAVRDPEGKRAHSQHDQSTAAGCFLNCCAYQKPPWLRAGLSKREDLKLGPPHCFLPRHMSTGRGVSEMTIEGAALSSRL